MRLGNLGLGALIGLVGSALIASGLGSGGQETATPRTTSVASFNDAAYADWLASNGIERRTVEPESGTRGVTAPKPGLWPLYPRGDTRPEAVAKYAIEVSAAGCPKGGVIELRNGKTVLYRDTSVFEPATRFVQGSFPTPVVEAIRPGARLTWGVYFADHPELDSEAPLRVLEKPAADRQIERVARQASFAAQPPVIKALGRSQILMNNSLFGEALRGYFVVAQDDPTVAESWTRIAECMRRLSLKEAPLFSDALIRASNSTSGNARNRTRPGGGLGDDSVATSNAGRPQAGQPGRSQPAASPPTGPAAGGVSPEARKALGAMSDMAARRTAAAESEASRTQQALEAARQALAEATAAAQAAEASANEQARAMAQARAEEAARRVADAERAAQEARIARERSEGDQRLMAEWARIMGGENVPQTPEERDVRLQALAGWASGLSQEADAARAAAEELNQQATAAEAHGQPNASELRAAADAAAAEATTKRDEALQAEAKVRELTHAMRDPNGH